MKSVRPISFFLLNTLKTPSICNGPANTLTLALTEGDNTDVAETKSSMKLGSALLHHTPAKNKNYGCSSGYSGGGFSEDPGPLSLGGHHGSGSYNGGGFSSGSGGGGFFGGGGGDSGGGGD